MATDSSSGSPLRAYSEGQSIISRGPFGMAVEYSTEQINYVITQRKGVQTKRPLLRTRQSGADLGGCSGCSSTPISCKLDYVTALEALAREVSYTQPSSLIQPDRALALSLSECTLTHSPEICERTEASINVNWRERALRRHYSVPVASRSRSYVYVRARERIAWGRVPGYRRISQLQRKGLHESSA